MLKNSIFRSLVFSLCFTLLSPSMALADEIKNPESVEDLFSTTHTNTLVLQIETAIAKAQASEGVIPHRAAEEIANKADLQYVPAAEIAKEYRLVNHRMVALLNVWKRSLNEDGANYVHYGVTTVDVYDTVEILRIRMSILMMIEDMRALEDQLMILAAEHRDTVMMGRTLGQHALPITFGKKVAGWAAQNRRNIERLKDLLDRIEHMGVLKGAVGTHLGLGPEGRNIERKVARELGLGEPDPDDWHGHRDVFAEYGQVLALISVSMAAMGEEIFRLQTTDIGEVMEVPSSTTIGSSAMPHKTNPSQSEALIFYGRTIPRQAEVLLDDVGNYFERDNTSRPNRLIGEISVDASKMIETSQKLIASLYVNKQRMWTNLSRTDGQIMSPRIVQFLLDDLGKEDAEARVRDAVLRSHNNGTLFRDEVLADQVMQPLLVADIDLLMDARTYTGLASEQVEWTIAHIKTQRRNDPRLK